MAAWPARVNRARATGKASGAMTPGENDPLWRMRHALAGVGVALLLSVPIAAMIGRLVGDAAGGAYGARVAVYTAVLVYVIAGAAVLFIKVAQHETRPLTARRAGLWLASLWAWPVLLAVRRGR